MKLLEVVVRPLDCFMKTRMFLIREQGAYMFPSAITHFTHYVHFREKKNLSGAEKSSDMRQLRRRCVVCRKRGVRNSAGMRQKRIRPFCSAPFLQGRPCFRMSRLGAAAETLSASQSGQNMSGRERGRERQGKGGLFSNAHAGRRCCKGWRSSERKGEAAARRAGGD